MGAAVEIASTGAPPRLTVRRLAKRYPNGRVALKGVDLTVREGELVVILGSNGSGKSTMLRSIVRLIEPTDGEVLIDGREIAHLTGAGLREARMACGMIFQHANLVRRRNVLANVATGALGRHRSLGTALGLLPRAELDAARGFLTRSAWSSSPGSAPARCPAASSSASPSPAPSPSGRACSWPTSRWPASTRNRRARSWRCCGGSRARTGSPSWPCCISRSWRWPTPTASSA